jgi:DNA-binding NarL/FixJ family response regulator
VSPEALIDSERRARTLTKRERQVADLVLQGQTSKEIAQSLGIADKTVEVYLDKLFKKLDVHNRASMARVWIGSGQSSQTPPIGKVGDNWW